MAKLSEIGWEDYSGLSLEEKCPYLVRREGDGMPYHTLFAQQFDRPLLERLCALEDQVAHTDWKGDSRAFWNLAVSAPPNPIVVECIENGQPVDYQNVQSLSDFVLIQVGWMISGLHFATSRRLCRERSHLAYRRKFLHELTDSPAIDRVCDIAEHVVGA